MGEALAFYNENDPKAAAWLRELIKAGLIAEGIVDERDIRDIRPDELAGFTQCHFFAGIGGWSLALRLAGWPDDRAVWTGSCPCQPFSAAGRGKGVADERHLWPHWFHLIQECKPSNVFGEQVASKDGLGWFDTVQTDLEATGYAVGAADLCAAGLGAPHIRQRLWFVAKGVGHSGGAGLERHGGDEQSTERRPLTVGPAPTAGTANIVADAASAGLPGRHGEASGKPKEIERPERLCAVGRLADSNGKPRGVSAGPKREKGFEIAGCIDAGRSHSSGPSPTNGFWGAADWLHCQDGKWRSVEPGTFTLAHGVSDRVGQLRGYGNAIVPEVAQAFIAAYMEI